MPNDPIPVTENNVYKAFQLQFARDAMGWDPNQGSTSWNRRRNEPSASILRIPSLYIFCVGLQRFVNVWENDKHLGSHFKDGVLACFVAGDKLAEKFGISRSKVSRHLARARTLGIIQDEGALDFGHIKMPVMGLGRWRFHPTLPKRVAVWNIDVAVGDYTGEHEKKLLKRYQELLDAQQDDTYRELSLF